MGIMTIGIDLAKIVFAVLSPSERDAQYYGFGTESGRVGVADFLSEGVLKVELL